MSPKIPLFFQARSLHPYLIPGEDPRYLVCAIDAFLAGCLAARRLRHPDDWQDFLLEFVQNAYVQISTARGMQTVLDGKTGRPNNICWYNRYILLIKALHVHYYGDVMNAIDHAHTLGLSIQQMRYVQHTAHYLMVEAACQHLLVHEASLY
jgi:hypothetical protein